ncbi:hypothetical protein CONLIGDRAFT_110225 [Coniochaeta ligniaria NRRL 30616]|uniref:Uncharacterized protein n=1 Tax=Coniochaeta ligniaria NRRL 30616 TaxID=1408157 RepID=A0A1J7I840_9PEZI|nr:hypothetical protein CONLIGDRAFT_110225 [Coniochaeta ligniaria NRRL 30616]
MHNEIVLHPGLPGLPKPTEPIRRYGICWACHHCCIIGWMPAVDPGSQPSEAATPVIVAARAWGCSPVFVLLPLLACANLQDKPQQVGKGVAGCGGCEPDSLVLSLFRFHSPRLPSIFASSSPRHQAEPESYPIQLLSVEDDCSPDWPDHCFKTLDVPLERVEGCPCRRCSEIQGQIRTTVVRPFSRDVVWERARG